MPLPLWLTRLSVAPSPSATGVYPLKSNRKVALSASDKTGKEYTGIGTLQPGQRIVEVWLEELDFPLLLAKQVFDVQFCQTAHEWKVVPNEQRLTANEQRASAH